jgi:hypothetical protein
VVYLLNDAGQPLASARSNAHGMYELANVPPGRYRLKAGQLGYGSLYNDGFDDFDAAVPKEFATGKYEVNFSLEIADVTDVRQNRDSRLPATVELYGNYPNPFNPQTSIHFGLNKEMDVSLRIYNLLGQEIAAVFKGRLAAGEHQVSWNGTDGDGRLLTSGIYLYVLESNGQRLAAQKMTLLK